MHKNHIHASALIAKSLSLSALIALTVISPGQAIDPADDAGLFGSITVAKQAREALKALDAQDYQKALNGYRAAIGMDNGVKEFYYGLLYSGQKAQAWDQVSVALDAIAEKDPEAKPHLAFEYGNCYAKTGRYEEAVPLLKVALLNKDKDNAFLSERVKRLATLTKAPAPPVVLSDEEKARRAKIAAQIEEAGKKPVAPPIVHADDQNRDKSKAGSDYVNAWLGSEWIGICEYRGYEKPKNGPILFNNPPTANFYWTEWIKGPPLNRHVPIKYKFYEHDGMTKPEGWKFGPDKMPAVGSKWIIFIPNAIPVEGGFDTYKGSYGRQEATDDNLGSILAEKETHHGQQ